MTDYYYYTDGSVLKELAALVVEAHNDGHDGAARFCEHEMCRLAWERL